MRPVNLIPPDARRGDSAATRTGGVPYALMAGLGLILLFVIALTFTSKQIDDRTAEVAQLNQKLTTTTAKAESLNSFAEFGAVEQTRSGTISSLAQSRFDWERVLNELALIIPPDVWLVQMAGTVNPEVQLDEAAEVTIRDSIQGPALEIIGCATSQDAVAGFIADLEDIDGVTRVGVASSARPEDASGDAAGTGTETTADSAGNGGECRTRDFITRFELAVAFDEVPVPGTATSAPGVPAPLAPGAAEVGEVQAQQTANSAEVAQGSAKAQNATKLIPGG